MEIRLIASDNILARYGNQLAALGQGLARTVMARALNHEGDKGRTQVKRALVTQTGINYNMIERGLATHRAHASRLKYELVQKGSETNIGLFNARETSKGVSAAPWNKRQVFPGTFFIPLGGGSKAPIVMHRTGKARYPIQQVYGPNLAREIVKDKAAKAWRIVPTTLAARVGHEIARELH